MTLRRFGNRLSARWRESRDFARWWRRGLPHGWNVDQDIQRRLRTPIEIIVDVGANIGQSAVRFRRAYPKAALYCLEPGADAFRLLQRTIAQWSDARAFQLALGSKVGRGELRGANDMAQVVSTAEGTIRIETLQTWMGAVGLTTIDYLKVDTEGHDLEVLKGGVEAIQSGAIGIIEVETGMNPDNSRHVAAGLLVPFLEPFGYRIFGIYEQTLEWPTADAYLRRANLVFVSPLVIARNRWVDAER
jgi:FkbM family methyltransferase